jgi:hypothetical protein
MRFRRSKGVSQLLIVLLSGLPPAVTTITTVLTRDWWRGSVKTVLMPRTTGSRMTVVVKGGEVLAAVTGEALASYFDVVSWAIPPGTPARDTWEMRQRWVNSAAPKPTNPYGRDRPPRNRLRRAGGPAQIGHRAIRGRRRR